MRQKKYHHSGYFVLFVLVFGSIFILMFTSLTGLIVTQKRQSERLVNSEQALQIAEAGLDYYRWYLAHNPNDTTNGTTTAQPYVHSYSDPEGGTMGAFELTIESDSYCGEVAAVDITSVGYTDNEPDITRVVYGRYARPTVSEYAYIINANVWAGDDRTIIGPYHSNGGIRMDGTNNSTVSSGVADWLCTGTYGCSPNSTEDGVFGDGPNSDLWQFPTPPINFVGLTVDFANMQSRAENEGIYVAPSGAYGYHVIFQDDGTFELYRVTDTYSYEGYTIEDEWETERNVIRDEVFIDSFAIPGDCPVIYIEDTVWLEGVVNGRVTIAAADVDTIGRDPTIIFNNSITYADLDGDNGLLALAEEDMLVGLVVPNDMELNGIFIAQNGRFGRNHYAEGRMPAVCTRYFFWQCVLWEGLFEEYITRNTLTINGTIVSNGRVGTQWVSNGSYASGFAARYNSYDRDLVTNPPPLTPHTSEDYTFIEWREVEK